MPYKENRDFVRQHKKYGSEECKDVEDSEAKLLQFVLAHTPANDPAAILAGIDSFCSSTWMMNLGGDKGEILKLVLEQHKPATILELGGYCGFSALLFAHHSKATVHTIEPNEAFASVAHRIHQHAGVADRIVIHLGTVQTQQDFLRQHGKFDLVFIDHLKQLYLQDFLELERLEVVKKGTVVVGDNIIFPGSPDYLKHFQESERFDSVLYHSYVEYCDIPDAVLVSHCTAE